MGDRGSKDKLLSRWKQIFLFFLFSTWLLISYYGAKVEQESLLTDLKGNLILDIPQPIYQDEYDPEAGEFSDAKSRVEPHQIPSANDQPEGAEGLDQDFNFTNAKKILYFTKYFDLADFHFGFGHQPFVDAKCPETNCYATDKKDLLPSMAEFDAILFHMRNMNGKKLEIPNQSKRRRNQRYVMFLMESPQHDNFPYKKLQNFFNWTMTYRSDSDIPKPYGWIDLKSNYSLFGRTAEERKEMPPWLDISPDWKPSQELRDMLKKKKKMVAWVVSNCRTESQREDFVRDLRKHVQVDVMGGCGPVKCDKGHRDKTDNCSLAVDQDYKFYLSFENSICKEYVTEKFFRRIDQNVVPIVLGASNYSEIAPPHSYINSLKFESPLALATYLKDLDKNDEEYLKYFWWKDHYVVRWRNFVKNNMCRLCQMLNSDLPEKVYPDLTDWWVKGGRCMKPGKYPWSVKRPNYFLNSLNNFAASLMKKPTI